MIIRRNVSFDATDGTALSGWLFQPEKSGERLPAITMAHGFGATKHHGLEPFATAFAEAGFVVLVHDHRNLGDSAGAPRHDIDPWRQIEDWRQAISFLETVESVDPQRIGLWGTSYSGGHALVLGATDRRLRAIVSQVPTIDGYASGLRRVPPADVPAMEAAFDNDLRGQLRGSPPVYRRLADADPSVPAQYHSKDTVDFFMQPVPAGSWINQVTLQSNRRARLYEPGRWIARVSPTPMLMIVATNDTTAPSDMALAAYEQALEPKSLRLIGGGHYSPYLKSEGFDQSCSAALDWFRKHLAPSQASLAARAAAS